MSIKFQHDIWQIRLTHSRVPNKRTEEWRVILKEGYVIPTKKGERFICVDQYGVTVPSQSLRFGLAQMNKQVKRRASQLKVFRNYKSMGKQLFQYLKKGPEGLEEISAMGISTTSIEYKEVPIPFLHPNFPNRGAIILLLETKAEQLPPDEQAAIKEGLGEIKDKFNKIKHLL